MKKIFFILICLITCITLCNAQESTFSAAEYIPSYPGGNYQYSAPKPQTVIITGYEYNGYNWVRCKLKVQVTKTGQYITDLTVLEKYDKTRYGWSSVCLSATHTNRWDGDYIYQNFDYKIPYHQIYFNLE